MRKDGCAYVHGHRHPPVFCGKTAIFMYINIAIFSLCRKMAVFMYIDIAILYSVERLLCLRTST